MSDEEFYNDWAEKPSATSRLSYLIPRCRVISSSLKHLRNDLTFDHECDISILINELDQAILKAIEIC